MTTGLVLIAAILILGGVIATVGDRLGMRVGKARLSLFKLRPRQTATLITIMTGGIIAASTLGILFAIDDRLRTGVFELERILRESRQAQDELAKATQEREQIQQRLNTARQRQQRAQQRLEQINKSLQAAIEQQTQTQQRLNNAEAQLQRIQTQFQQAQTLIQVASRQAAQLQAEIRQLQSDRAELIRQRDSVRAQIAERDQEIAARDQAIAEREGQLRELEDQRALLQQDVQSLEEQFQGLRQGNVTLFRNQLIVSSDAFQIVDPAAAPELIAQALWQANRAVLQRIQPTTTNFDPQVIQFDNSEVNQLIEKISDGKPYVLRIYSAGNYVIGEPCVLAGRPCIQVVATAVPNELVFTAGEVVAATSVNPATIGDEALAEVILRLISSAQFRARQAGIPGDRVQVADNRTDAVVEFFQRVKQLNQPIDIQVIATENAETAGTARLQLLALQNGQVLFGTQ